MQPKSVCFLLAGLFLMSSQVEAQWLTQKTPGIPRTVDGKPNLSGPAPRTADGKPDLSGLWTIEPHTRPRIDKALLEINAQPWAESLSKKRAEEFYKDNMSVLCLPVGPKADREIRKLVQTPGLIVLLYDDLTYRQVFLDGRALEQDPNPAWMGYSVGHWEGDTLVIESAGFNDRTWLYSGYPHTEALHMTERLRRTDFGHMVLERRLDDPKALVQPVAVTIQLELDSDTEMIEYVCNENERDRPHMTGTFSDYKKAGVSVAPGILSKYVGSYAGGLPAGPQDLLFKISMVNGQLVVDGGPHGRRPLTPVSESHFTATLGEFEFLTDDHGVVTHLQFTSADGEMKTLRRQ